MFVRKTRVKNVGEILCYIVVILLQAATCRIGENYSVKIYTPGKNRKIMQLCMVTGNSAGHFLVEA